MFRLIQLESALLTLELAYRCNGELLVFQQFLGSFVVALFFLVSHLGSWGTLPETNEKGLLEKNNRLSIKMHLFALFLVGNNNIKCPQQK